MVIDVIDKDRILFVAIEHVATTYPNMEPLWQQNILSFEAGAIWALAVARKEYEAYLSKSLSDYDNGLSCESDKSKSDDK
jgi:hypothetical protein